MFDALADGKGYIVSVDQLPHESVFHVYRREGEPVAMNSASRNFLMFRWRDIASAATPAPSAARSPATQ